MKTISSFRFATLLIVVALAAGCDRGSSLAVQIADYTFDPNDQLIVTLMEDGRIRMFERPDFAPIPLRASSDVGPFAVANAGTAAVSVRLMKSDVTIASGTVTVQLRDEEDWRVRVFRSVADPRATQCPDCENSMRFDIVAAHQREAGEGLWVVW
jgi:hypothetical protein